MKLLPESSCVLFLLLLVELPVLAMSRPTPMRHRKDSLTKLSQKMRRLINIVQRAVHHLDTSLPFEHNLTSLPTLNFRPRDLAAVTENSTLSQLSSGLHSFKLHFDWLLYWHNQSGLVSNKIKEIADEIQSISMLEQIQTNSSGQNTLLSMPPLTSAWDIYRTSAVIHKRLLDFCNWYLRALQVLIYKQTTDDKRGHYQEEGHRYI
ncbi:uncharacterized protein il11b isoform X1 [Ictalurus punctatus]|uniref:Uncharacterized protein il11b isoform X1 n=2 Tax=Ictalurus punctatus TaxID=7998 RepID=A0A2D0S0Q6_ICTPU|nr:uncharacterized protein il11b isoform X1 [Ictalurus punctatus]